MEVVTGYVEHIVFRNEDNGYTVFNLENEDGELTCVGNFPLLNVGECLELTGSYSNHSVYGTQLKVETFSLKEPEDIISIERYLGSGAIKGIGVALAGRIVSAFGQDSFHIVENEPERLAEIKGISLKKARDIAAIAIEKKDLRQAMIFLQKYGISVALSAKIYQHYGPKIYKILKENPYQIADHIPGVGFKTVDEIALKGGQDISSCFRLRSGLLYALTQSLSEGHTYLPQETLVAKANHLLGCRIDEVELHLRDLAMERKIVTKKVPSEILGETGEKAEEVRVYTAHFYYLELRVAKLLHQLDIKCQIPKETIEKQLEVVEKDKEILLDGEQRLGVIEAIQHGLMVLTGGPGTGKTTTINAIIRFFENEGMSIALAAPTGRAAKRMTEATGFEAQTIHRLLEVGGNPEDDSLGTFQKNAENPLEVDVIIIDEMSMVDLPLMDALLSAIITGSRLILVGDVNQLPSVGPGSVLKDIIASGKFPVVTLNKIFRQAEESDIVVNAHKINKGERVSLDNKSKDFFFLKRQDADTIIRVILTLIQEKLPKYVNASPLEIQVMTPSRRGLLGVERLNKVLQNYLNPKQPMKKEVEIQDRIFREGDKVMQIKNNYQLEWEVRSKYGLAVDSGSGIFNGDMGLIKEINTSTETVEVLYDEGRMVTYPYELLVELELAYAITVHKSQGSEYPAVVLPLLSGPKLLFNRNLLYTAVTRAKKCLTIVGSGEVFQEMIQNQREQSRYTGLKERILEL